MKLILAVCMILLIHSCVTDDEKDAKIQRRSGGTGGGYVKKYGWTQRDRYTTHTRFICKIRVMVMALLADIHTKLEKITFIRRWSEKGKAGKAAQTARMIYKVQQMYNKLIRMYTFTNDNFNYMNYDKVQGAFLNAKKLAMEIDHMIQMILEFENEDPSGRVFGRAGREIPETVE